MDWGNTLAGLFVGLVVGMTGVGGGSLMTPILIWLGFPITTAVGTDLWFAGITKTFGAAVHHRQDSADFKIVGWLWVGSLPVAILTLLWLFASGHSAADYKSNLIVTMLGVVLLASALATLRRSWITRQVILLKRRSLFNTKRWKPHLTILAGAILGLLVTLTSVGAGALGATMLLILYPLRLTAKKLVGTDIAHAVPLTLVAGCGYLLYGSVDLKSA